MFQWTDEWFDGTRSDRWTDGQTYMTRTTALVIQNTLWGRRRFLRYVANFKPQLFYPLQGYKTT